MTRFVFTANSPGEVATWLAPAVRALRRRDPEALIAVYIVPCAFAAGTETDVVRRLPEVDLVFGPRDYWRVALGGSPPPELAPGPGPSAGALLYLGGDLVHALRLGRRLKLPSLAYVERGSRWTKSFAELLVADEEARRRVEARGEDGARIRIVGNLMVDAVAEKTERSAAARDLSVSGEGPVLAVFPGSRPYEIERSLPFLLRAAEIVRDGTGHLQVVISLSSFAGPDALAGNYSPRLEGTTLHVEAAPERGGWLVTTGGGLTAFAVQGVPYDVMAAADAALTLPGSNTAEMAAAGLPMVVVLPLNLAEEIPLPGAAQYVEKIPVVGPALKSRLVRSKAAQMPFVAWPNRKAGRAVVPEVRGELTPRDVADAATSLLGSPKQRAAMAEQLRRTMGPGGAADRIASRLLAAAGRAIGEAPAASGTAGLEGDGGAS